MDALQAAVIVSSDRCAFGLQTDTSGAFLQKQVQGRSYLCASPLIVPDEMEAISDAISAAIGSGSRLIITAGGTGVGPRDVVPEATYQFIEQPLPGISQYLMNISLDQTPLGALSRGLVGLTGARPKALIVNLPGSLNAVQCLTNPLLDLLPHVFSQVDRVPNITDGFEPHEI